MDGINSTNPFDGMTALEIQCEIDALDEVKAEFNALLAKIAARKIPSLDMGDLSGYVDALVTDVIEDPKRLAEEMQEDAPAPYSGPGREEAAKEKRWSA